MRRMKEHPRLIAIVTTLVCLSPLLTPAMAKAAGQGAQMAKAAGYLSSRQQADGGFAEPGEGATTQLSCMAVVALRAAGDDAFFKRGTGDAARRFLEKAAAGVESLKDIELLAIALPCCGADQHNASGRDLVALTKAAMGSDGRIGADLEQHCLGMIALAVAGEQIPSDAVGWLLSQQKQDGSWSGARNTTAASAQALEATAAVGSKGAEAIGRGLDFLKSRMQADGGFPGATARTDTPSTSVAARAIAATGQSASSGDWDSNGVNPISFLASLQGADGHEWFQTGVDSEPAMATAVAEVAFSSKGLSEIARGSEPASAAVADDGKVGASLSAADGPSIGEAQKSQREAGYATGGAYGTGSGGPGGLINFLVACAFYLLVLAALSVLSVLAARGARKKL